MTFTCDYVRNDDEYLDKRYAAEFYAVKTLCD